MINDELPAGDTYVFNGRILSEWGYYTTVYPQSDCDSVVGLTLEEHWGLEPYDDAELFQETSLQVYDLTGRMVRWGKDISTEVSMDLAPGLYIVRWFDGKRLMAKKVLVQ